MGNKKGIGGTVVAGVVGAMVGVAAGAAAVALSDEKNRQKVGKVAGEWKEKGLEVADSVKKEAQAVGKIIKGQPAKAIPAAKK